MKRPSYNGGKGGTGVYQFLINWLKPTHHYISLFAGLDAVIWNLPNKPQSIWINDIDQRVIETWQQFARGKKQQYRFSCFDYRDVLAQLTNEYQKTEEMKTTIFIDPPYLMSTRRSQQSYYKNELHSEAEHRELIDEILAFNANCPGFQIMITHYPCDLYAQKFKQKGWTITEFIGRTHKGTVKEWLITNYPKPSELQDYSFLGSDSLKRQDIKRKIARFEQNFRALDPLVRNAILTQLKLKQIK